MEYPYPQTALGNERQALALKENDAKKRIIQNKSTHFINWRRTGFFSL